MTADEGRTTRPGGLVGTGRPFVLDQGEELLEAITLLAGPPRGVPRWLAIRHQARLWRRVQRITRLFAEGERAHRDALDLIRDENRRLHRRAPVAGGVVARARGGAEGGAR